MAKVRRGKCPRCGVSLQVNVERQNRSRYCPECGHRIRWPEPHDLGSTPTADLLLSDTLDEESAFGSEPVWIPVVCSLCDTRMHARPEQQGQMIRCPDCGKENTVGPPPNKKVRSSPLVHDDYSLADDEQIPRQHDPRDSLGRELLAEAREALQQTEQTLMTRDEWNRPVHVPIDPERFSLFHINVWPQWAGIAVLVWILLVGVYAVQDMVKKEIEPVFIGLLAIPLFLAGIFVGGFWSTRLLRLIQGTANGEPELTDWPDVDIATRLANFFYMSAATTFSCLPGVGIMVLSQAYLQGMAAISFYAFFPIVLLSQLESGSPFIPYSTIIWRSLRAETSSWMRFYAQSLLCMLLASGLIWYLAQAPHWLIRLPVASLLVMTSFVYARQLGHLGRRCLEVVIEDDAEIATDDQALIEM